MCVVREQAAYEIRTPRGANLPGCQVGVLNWKVL